MNFMCHTHALPGRDGKFCDFHVIARSSDLELNLMSLRVNDLRWLPYRRNGSVANLSNKFFCMQNMRREGYWASGIRSTRWFKEMMAVSDGYELLTIDLRWAQARFYGRLWRVCERVRGLPYIESVIESWCTRYRSIRKCGSSKGPWNRFCRGLFAMPWPGFLGWSIFLGDDLLLSSMYVS